MPKPRDMKKFRATSCVARGVAVGVDEGWRVMFICAAQEIFQCQGYERLIWNMHPDDYEAFRVEMFRRFGNPPGDA